MEPLLQSQTASDVPAPVLGLHGAGVQFPVSVPGLHGAEVRSLSELRSCTELGPGLCPSPGVARSWGQVPVPVSVSGLHGAGVRFPYSNAGIAQS